MLKAGVLFLRSFSANVIFWTILNKILGRKIPNLKKWQDFVKEKKCIEIGGPSQLFRTNGYFPIYSCIKSIDGVNFNQETVWEGKLEEGNTYICENKIGHQFIAEATNLNSIADNSYDVVISCNNLEHIANPLKAIVEWRRILNNKGIIILILPNKNANFDHRRKDTTFDHVLNDYHDDIGEDDLTHLDEILHCHDLKRDPQAGNFKSFKSRCLENYKNRCLHHHIFNQQLLVNILNHAKFSIVHQYSSSKDHFIAAQKC